MTTGRSWAGRTLLVLTAALMTVLAARPARAQQTGEPSKQIQSLQQQLELTRRQRLELEARLERELAAEIAERARRLQMGGEVGALQRLEALLDSAQARLLVQRDRLRLLGDAARQAEGALLVVLLRADSLPATEVTTSLAVDEQPVGTRTLSPDQIKVIGAGGAEELYRAEVTPLAHGVVLTLQGRGVSVSERVQITPQTRQVTYVEFALRGGRLVPATWTSASTTPF